MVHDTRIARNTNKNQPRTTTGEHRLANIMSNRGCTVAMDTLGVKRRRMYKTLFDDSVCKFRIFFF